MYGCTDIRTEGLCPKSRLLPKKRAFHLSWLNLKYNLEFKIDCATSDLTASQEAVALSKSIVQLLRWQLPSSGLAYNNYDSSVGIDDVAAYLKVETGLILAASFSKAGAGKMRTLVFVKRAGVGLSEQ